MGARSDEYHRSEQRRHLRSRSGVISGRSGAARAQNPPLSSSDRGVAGRDDLSSALRSRKHRAVVRRWADKGSARRRSGVCAAQPEWAKCTLFIQADAPDLRPAAKTRVRVRATAAKLQYSFARRPTLNYSQVVKLLATADNSGTAASCPKCGFEQEGLECARCGIIFSKYKPPVEHEEEVCLPHPKTAEPAKAGLLPSMRILPWLSVGITVTVLFLILKQGPPLVV